MKIIKVYTINKLLKIKKLLMEVVMIIKMKAVFPRINMKIVIYNAKYYCMYHE